MKTIRNILFIIVILLSLLSIISIIFCLCETIRLQFLFSKIGFLNFLNYFSGFKNLYASSIAMVSIYYWIFQIDNIEKTNKRLENEKTDKKKANSIVESRYFHTKIQPIIRDFYDIILEKDKTLFEYTWVYTVFTLESVLDQHPVWDEKYELIRKPVEKYINSVNFELDSLASNILHGNIDKVLIFKLIGKPFCSQVRILYPFIAAYRGAKRKIDYFNNIVDLFNEWNLKVKE
jgi:hypothetical protein